MICKWVKIGPLFAWAYIVAAILLTERGPQMFCVLRMVTCEGCV